MDLTPQLDYLRLSTAALLHCLPEQELLQPCFGPLWLEQMVSEFDHQFRALMQKLQELRQDCHYRCYS